MDTASILISVATIACSGVVSGVVTNKLAANRAELDFKRTKLEATYEAAHKFCHLLLGNIMPWLDVMDNKIDYNKALENSLDGRKDGDNEHYPQLIMLVNIYFRELRNELKAILDARDRISRCITGCRGAYKEGQNYSAFIQPALEAMTQLDLAHQALNKRLFKLADRIK